MVKNDIRDRVREEVRDRVWARVYANDRYDAVNKIWDMVKPTIQGQLFTQTWLQLEELTW